MKRIALLAGLAVAPAAAHAHDLTAPIAQAAKGQMQCYGPNTAGKTCQSLAAYHMLANGTITNTATSLISAKPLVTMQTVSPVEIRDGQVCGTIRAEDIVAAKFMLEGKPLTGQMAGNLQQQIAAASKPIFGHEICTAYVADGDGFIAKATDNGAPISATPRVIWISPGDGYKVAP